MKLGDSPVRRFATGAFTPDDSFEGSGALNLGAIAAEIDGSLLAVFARAGVAATVAGAAAVVVVGADLASSTDTDLSAANTAGALTPLAEPEIEPAVKGAGWLGVATDGTGASVSGIFGGDR